MYQLDWVAQLRSRSGLALTVPRDLAVHPTVWKLGFTSLLTDVSSEMVSSILPLYFVLYLHFSPLQFGLLDGISQGAAVALLSLASGIMADRWHAQKQVAIAGYAFSALSKVALLLAGGAWTVVAGILALDRVGKGIRTAPRDAMISLVSPREKLATAFAVHRGLDTCGAILGPLLAFLVLRILPGSFDRILMISFCVAIVGIGLLALLVEKPTAGPADQTRSAASFRQSLSLFRQPRFCALTIAAALLGLATASDGFIFLMVQKRLHSSASDIPLYAFLTASSYLLLSIPAGRLADRWGRTRVFLGGHVLLAGIYCGLLWAGWGSQGPFLLVGLLGAYYAATDGVMAAMVSATIGPDLRTSGLALLNTVSSLARLVSSVLFGWAWVTHTMDVAVWSFLGCLSAAIMLSGVIFSKYGKPA